MELSAEKPLKHLPPAATLREQLVSIAAEKTAEEAQARAAADRENKKLIEGLLKPSGVSDEEAGKRVSAIVERAVSNGLHEVKIYRFPNALCTDQGRAISQNESGWEQTLTGVPKELYEFWSRALRPLGYKIRFEIIEWPSGMRGDVAVTLRWV